jgi:hypothetical protein
MGLSASRGCLNSIQPRIIIVRVILDDLGNDPDAYPGGLEVIKCQSWE